MTNKLNPRQFAIITGKRRGEIEVNGGDLVWVVVASFPEIHKSFCFFKNFVSSGEESFVELEQIDGMDLKIPEKMFGGLEVVAKNGTREYEVLTDTILENIRLKSWIKKLKKHLSEEV